MEEVEGLHAVIREVQLVGTLKILHHLLQQMRGGAIVIDDEDSKHGSPPLALVASKAFTHKENYQTVVEARIHHSHLRGKFITKQEG
jgi:hypothetical protein